jgi:hypothetical protein
MPTLPQVFPASPIALIVGTPKLCPDLEELVFFAACFLAFAADGMLVNLRSPAQHRDLLYVNNKS